MWKSNSDCTCIKEIGWKKPTFFYSDDNPKACSLTLNRKTFLSLKSLEEDQ